jgi:hypothetical protein
MCIFWRSCTFGGWRGTSNFDFGISSDIPLDIALIKVNIGVAVKDLSYSAFVLIDV